MRNASRFLPTAIALVAVACQTPDISQPGGNTTARVVARDVSQPSGPASTTATVSGTVTFTGLTVELWDGSEWLSVANGSGSATLEIGDGTAAATLVPASAIPAGDYSKARVSADNANVDVDLNGQGFSAKVGNPTLGPLEIEKTVSVTVNPDGSRTFSIEFQMIRTVSLASGANGPVVQLSGDIGTLTVPATTAPGSVRALDVSQPVDGSGAPVDVTGTVTFTGLSIELWDGEQWLSVVNGTGSATVDIRDGALAATLVPVAAIPAGDYSRIRIGATETVAQVTAVIEGQEVAAAIRPPSPFVVEKDVTVTVNDDGSRTFEVQLMLVRTVSITPDPITGAPRLDLTGDLTGRL